MKGGFVYIMSNKRDGTLYIGVTGNLSRRIWEHREGVIDGFSKRYGLKRLVYYEPYDDIRNALQREKNMKHWPRAWKLALIHEMNPDWEDLYERAELVTSSPALPALFCLDGRARPGHDGCMTRRNCEWSRFDRHDEMGAHATAHKIGAPPD